MGGVLRRMLRRRGVAPGDTDDITQAVMLHLLSRWGEVEARSSAEQRAFAIRRALGAAVDLARRERRARDADGLVDSATSTSNPERAALAREAVARAEAIAEAVDRVDGGVWRLHVVEEMTCREISARLRLPLGTVKTRLRKSRAAVAALARDSAEGRRAPGGEESAPSVTIPKSERRGHSI